MIPNRVAIISNGTQVDIYEDTSTAASAICANDTSAASTSTTGRVFRQLGDAIGEIAKSLKYLEKDADRILELALSRNWVPAPLAIVPRMGWVQLPVAFHRRLSARQYTGRNFRK